MLSPFLSEGLLHPLVTPSHLLLMLGLALLLGQQASLKKHWLSYVLAFLAGLIANRVLDVDWTPEPVLLSIALVISLLTVLKINVHAWILLASTVISAVLMGLDSTPIVLPGLGLDKILTWQAVSIISSSLLLIVSSLVAYFLRNVLQGIPLRVIASWIATSALLVLTLSIFA